MNIEINTDMESEEETKYEYNCDLCDFRSNDRHKYYSHLNTKRHNDKIFSPNNICYYCNKEFTTKYSYKRHITSVHHTYKEDGRKKRKKSKRDKEEKEIDDMIKIKDKKGLTELVKVIKKQEKRYDKLQKMYEKELEEKNKQIKVMSSVTTTALKYAKLYFNEADKLEYKEIKFIGLQTEDKTNNNDFKLEKSIINKYYDKKLAEYLGDLIIKQYKTKNKKKQSLWNTDISRLTFIIRECIEKDKNNEIDWITDKQGKKILELIIKPLINHLKDILDKYHRILCDLNYDGEPTKKLKEISIIYDIMKDINNDILSQDILKYMASDFYLERK